MTKQEITSTMKNSKENDYKIQIRIIYCLILLLFLLFFALLFIIVYYKQSDCNMKSEKTADGNSNKNLNTASHQVKKREISSKIDKECERDCSVTENSSEENNDTIVMKGKWNVKKSDLLEYCFNADDFCRRNREKSKDEQKDNAGGEKQEDKDCILRNISDYNYFYYYEYKDVKAMEDNYRLLFPKIEEGPENNFRIITQ
ncbi:uncharacterized protein [Centruroides vittatus]|uniref:uncharacterized protein n=1 Tax=Centruroides vittatus TaxID=120091 RepID=UPI00350F273B